MSEPSPQQDVWTVQRILDWTTGHLRKHGSDSPRLEAEILLAHARNCRRIELYTRFDEPLSDDQRAAMRDLVQRRTRHEPVAYLVGQREFFGLPFRVTRDVLIPRPDTETLVVETLDAVRSQPAPRIVDVGTGSGCIAISIAKNRADALVTAIDASEPALAVARENASLNEVADRVEFVKSDLFAALPEGRTFDVVVSNPPYIRDDEIETLQADVRLHEPHTALAAGADGLEVIRRLIADAPAVLRPGGRLLIEFSPEQAESVREMLEANGAYEEVRLIRDLSHQFRAVSAQRR